MGNLHQACKEVWVIHPRGRLGDIREFENICSSALRYNAMLFLKRNCIVIY